MFYTHVKKVFFLATMLSITLSAYAQETLIFAFDIVRHGDRTPLLVIPNAPHTWTEGMGQLTARGMRQEMQLGNNLRKKYIDQYKLLPSHFDNESIYVFSTDFPRTLMSAQSLLLGLYPLGTGPHLSTKQPALPVAFQPIPVHTQPKASDPFLGDTDPAKFEQQLNQYVISQPQWTQKMAEFQQKLTKWSQATGLTFTDPQEIILLADTLRIDQTHRVPLPAELKNSDAKEIIAAGFGVFATIYQTKEIAVLAGTPILTKVADYLQKANQQPAPLKYVLFLAHDSTIMSVMTTLGKPLHEQPPFASDLNFSLFKTEQGNNIVRVTYNDKPVLIPGCSPTGCTLEQFMKARGQA